MFGRYALPSANVALGTTPSASAEDTGYPAANLVIGPPSNPARLTTYDGYWDVPLGSSMLVIAVAVIYPNFDAGLDATIEPNGGTPVALIVPAQREDGTFPSPWVYVNQTTDSIRLAINEANTLLPEVGQLIILTALPQLSSDVRWGVVEEEEFGIIAQQTELGVDLISEIGGTRRSISGEFGLTDTEAASLIALHRSAKGRVLPWLLIPDEAVNDAWLVQFEESKWSRTRETINHNIFPFRVKELARGTSWP